MSYKREKKKNYANIIFAIVCGIIGVFLGLFSTGFMEKASKAGNDKQMSFIELTIFIGGIYLAYFLCIIIHEGGHLVMGLATGYKFLSFRIGSLVLVKTDKGLKFKKYSIAGTGGQCLLDPPDVENPENAQKEYDLAYKMKKNYPNVGEADSELAIIEFVKKNYA